MMIGREGQRAFKIALACSAAMALQGCIAAAFPIAAGGLMASEGGVDPEGEQRSEPAPSPSPTPTATPTPAPPPPPAPAPEPAQLDPQVIVEPSPPAAPAQEPAAIEPSAVAESEADVETTNEQADMPEVTPPSRDAEPVQTVIDEAPPAPEPEPVLVTPVAEEAEQVADTAEAEEAMAQAADEPQEAMLDTPDEPTRIAAADITRSAEPSTSATVPEPTAPMPPAPPASTAPVSLFDPLYDYAGQSGFQEGDGRLSATLIDPARLNPERAKCSIGRPTVLLDLDPADGDLLPIDPLSASAALAQRLSQLRRNGVAIAWISGVSDEFTADIRAGLFRAGLDQSGRDTLLLMRSSDDRKQTRRDQLAETSCLVAIAGDEQADFHELFDYLRNPSDAAALEPLMGEGWFLIPTPLLSERPRR